jgi:GNAT superfamily N-acetyltransferase
MSNIEIKALSPSPEIRAMLSEILIETVANGGSVSFMHPLSQEAAEAFWRDSLAAAGRDERIVLGAFDGESLIGTVTLLLSLPPNQPHRAEIAKMMTRVSHRHRGIATALLREAERIAIERGRWLLVLDTAEDGRRRPVRADGIQADWLDSRLRTQTPRWPHRDADLLEAVARAARLN